MQIVPQQGDLVAEASFRVEGDRTAVSAPITHAPEQYVDGARFGARVCRNAIRG